MYNQEPELIVLNTTDTGEFEGIYVLSRDNALQLSMGTIWPEQALLRWKNFTCVITCIIALDEFFSTSVSLEDFTMSDSDSE